MLNINARYEHEETCIVINDDNDTIELSYSFDNNETLCAQAYLYNAGDYRVDITHEQFAQILTCKNMREIKHIIATCQV